MIEPKSENVLREAMRKNINSLPLNQRDDETAQASAFTADMLPALREARERMTAQLQVTERAQNRLPPLYSNRVGWAARLELWIKRRFQRATHWYVWEQLSFNAATDGALREALTMLSLYETLIENLQDHLRDVSSTAAQMAARQTIVTNQSTNNAIANNGAGNTPDTQLTNALKERTEELRAEQRAHTEQLLEAQRVSFKQLTLQLTEQAVATERAARIAQSRLDALETQLEELRRAAVKD